MTAVPLLHIGYLFLVALLLSVGQIALKILARNLGGIDSIADLLLRGVMSPLLWLAFAIYGAVMVFWVWLLTFIPLNVAYPFVMLTLAIVPILSYFVLSETVSLRYLIGLGLMMAGAIILVPR